MALFYITIKSIINRKFTAFLCILCIAMSMALLTLVNLVREGARESFFGTVSGVDLIVGARTGGINLLLYSVFRMGAPTNNISWKSYQELSKSPDIDWIVPISLGDSFRGFRVVGTSSDFFKRIRFRGDHHLLFALGSAPTDLYSATLGSEVAKRLDLTIGDRITLTHGISTGGFGNHTDKPFTITGILASTGTPIDHSVHVSMEAITAIHLDWNNGAPPKEGQEVSAEASRKLDLTPTTITAAFVGLKSKIALFRIQRSINQYSEEALMAVLPGVALTELWQIVSTVEVALLAVTGMVLVAGLIGLCATLLSTLNERRREMAVLRAVGASPFQIFLLLISESTFLTLIGIVVGICFAYFGLAAADPWIESRFGLSIPIKMPSLSQLKLIGVLLLCGAFSGVFPAFSAYRKSLSDGLSVRV